MSPGTCAMGCQKRCWIACSITGRTSTKRSATRSRPPCATDRLDRLVAAPTCGRDGFRRAPRFESRRTTHLSQTTAPRKPTSIRATLPEPSATAPLSVRDLCVGAVPVATVNRNGAIPELLTKANQNQGQGMFSKVTYIQRLRTTGGVAPAGSCTDGSQQATRYSAVYRFWSAAP